MEKSVVSISDQREYKVAGQEFEELQGHTLVIHKALYGLKSSGLRWSQRLHDIMLQLRFTCCKADPRVWLREVKNKYEYIAKYVDDLLIASEEPQQIIKDLKENFKLKIKGGGQKIGHLERMKRLYGYLAKTKHFAIRYRTKEPDYSHLPKHGY